mgnify:CR=1 FL=1
MKNLRVVPRLSQGGVQYYPHLGTWHKTCDGLDFSLDPKRINDVKMTSWSRVSVFQKSTNQNAGNLILIHDVTRFKSINRQTF